MINDIINSLGQRATSFLYSLDENDTSLVSSLKRQAGFGLINRLVGRAIPMANRSNFQVVGVGPGYLKAKIPLRDNRNHIGTLYAGAMFLVAEVPGGVLALLEFGTEYVPILKEMTISYLKPAQSDVTVEFRLSQEELARLKSDADSRGKADFTQQGELRDQQGELVARATGLYQLRKKGWHCGAS